jgi:hypothetical protein
MRIDCLLYCHIPILHGGYNTLIKTINASQAYIHQFQNLKGNYIAVSSKWSDMAALAY